MTIKTNPAQRAPFQHVEQFLHSKFTLVSTNVESLSIKTIVEKCQVFFLCESHDTPIHKELNSALIDSLWIEHQSKLFLEGNQEMEFSNEEISKNQQSWDINESAFDKFYLYNSTQIITYAKIILTLYKHSQGSSQTESLEKTDQIKQTLRLLEKSKFFEKTKKQNNLPTTHSKKSPPERIRSICGITKKKNTHPTTHQNRKLSEKIQSIRNSNYNLDELAGLIGLLSEDWIQLNTTFLQLTKKMTEDDFLERNKSLASSVVKAHRKGIQHIFLIAGTRHLKHHSDSPLEAQAVDFVERAMKESQIPYVILETKREETKMCSSKQTPAQATPKHEPHFMEALEVVYTQSDLFLVPENSFSLSDSLAYLRNLSLVINQIQKDNV